VAIAIVVLVPALLIPFWPVNGAGPRLTVGGNAVAATAAALAATVMEVDPAAAPTPTPAVTADPTPTATPDPTPTATPDSTPTATPDPTPSPKPASVLAPTPSPKAASVLAPTPSPKPASVPTPTPTPISAGIPVPASIDGTGATDASAALNAWVTTVPDGSTIGFPAGGIYRLDAAIKFAHRRNLTFEGNGATLRANGGTTEASSLFWLGSYGGGNSGIVIRDFSLVGNSSTPGAYQPGQEGAHAILVDGGSGINVSRVTVSGVWGDCLYVGGAASSVSFYNATCRSGRNGVTITSGSNVTVQGVAFVRSGYCTFDIEPNQASEAVHNVRLLANSAGSWSNSFFSADGAAGSVVDGLTVSGNTVTGGSLLTIIDLARRQNVVFTNNRSTVTAAGPVLRFAHIDGLTVTGNVQPLSSGSLASISDSTGVTYP
jgi:hypothetical protein